MTAGRGRAALAAPERTGVWHLTVNVEPGTDAGSLTLRIVMAHDVTSGESRTRYVVGPDAACVELRKWLQEVCRGAAAT